MPPISLLDCSDQGGAESAMRKVWILFLYTAIALAGGLMIGVAYLLVLRLMFLGELIQYFNVTSMSTSITSSKLLQFIFIGSEVDSFANLYSHPLIGSAFSAKDGVGTR